METQEFCGNKKGFKCSEYEALARQGQFQLLELFIHGSCLRGGVQHFMLFQSDPLECAVSHRHSAPIAAGRKMVETSGGEAVPTALAQGSGDT